MRGVFVRLVDEIFVVFVSVGCFRVLLLSLFHHSFLLAYFFLVLVLVTFFFSFTFDSSRDFSLLRLLFPLPPPLRLWIKLDVPSRGNIPHPRKRIFLLAPFLTQHPVPLLIKHPHVRASVPDFVFVARFPVDFRSRSSVFQPHFCSRSCCPRRRRRGFWSVFVHDATFIIIIIIIVTRNTPPR